MRVIRASSEEEAAETFVRAELQSPRFRDEVLAGTRGWRIGGLFGGLPAELEWRRVALTPDEVLSILYIDWDWWLTISDGTRSPREAARRIRAGLVPGGDPEPDRAIAARLRSADPPPELIAVQAPGGPMVLLEGHVRLTAYAVWPEYLPEELEILLGSAEDAASWGCY
jgi:hypothetical protein